MDAMRAIGVEEATDEELVARVRAGAFGVFETLVRRHARRVHRAVRSILRDESDVEDAVQQAFLQAFVAIRGFEGAAAFSTWMTRIAVNEALMRARQARRGPLYVVPDPELLPSGTAGPEQRAAARELVEAVGAAVRRLPARHRETLQLRCIEGLSVTQAAARLGVSEAAVKIRLSRARRVLRRALEPDERVAGARPRTVPRPGERAFTGDARG
jgi:RNA polymerase sigma-70 factor (ECF subfamily)